MFPFIRNAKDFWFGIIFILFGVAAVVIGRNYAMGTPGKMGPAYFPTILGGLLAIIGAISMTRSMYRASDAVGKIAVKELFIVLLATVLFGVMVRGMGLLPAVFVLVMVSGYASVKFKLAPLLAVAVGLAVFSVLVFVKALGLPMLVFGPWLGF